MAGEEAPGATSLCLILYPSPFLRQTSAPTQKTQLFKRLCTSRLGTESSSGFTAMVSTPVKEEALWILLAKILCWSSQWPWETDPFFGLPTTDSPLLLSSQAANCPGAGAELESSQQSHGKFSIFVDGLVCGQHFDGNYRTQEVIYSSLRKIVQNVSTNKSIWHHVMTSKFSERKAKIKLFCFLNKTEPNPGFEDWPQMVPCNGNWNKETERSNLEAMKIGFDLNKTLGKSAFLYLVLHFFKKSSPLGL